ncbi:MAG: hypothetical protein AB8G05_26465 [Oligoflexales bacterium]
MSFPPCLVPKTFSSERKDTKNLNAIATIISLFLVSCGGNFEHSRELGERTYDSEPSPGKGNSSSENAKENSDKSLEQNENRYSTLYETLPSQTQPSEAFHDGLYINFHNMLATHQANASLAVCSNLQAKERDNNVNESLCYVSDKTVAYNEQVNFYLNEEKLEKIFEFSNKRELVLKFNDEYSNSDFHWFCWEYPRTVIESTGLKRLKIELTQANLLSYSCRLELN